MRKSDDIGHASRVGGPHRIDEMNIPTHIYIGGLISSYCYAVEEFGMHLQQLARQGMLGPEIGSMRRALTFTCSEFGCSPTVTYGKRQLELSSIPNVFQWTTRETRDTELAEIKSLYIPHCTALRALIASMETGLSIQSVIWLDRLNWDGRNHNGKIDSDFFPLRLQNYKVRKTMTVYMSHRLHDLLRREQGFQESFTDANVYAPVKYEESRYNEILPLFRAAKSGLAISLSACSDAWKRLLVGFEGFYIERTGEHYVLPIRTPSAYRAMFQMSIAARALNPKTTAMTPNQYRAMTALYVKPSSQEDE